MKQNLSYEYIENLREIAGTLPSEQPIKRTNRKSFSDSVEIELIDHNENPYKAMFCTSTATWGNNEFKNKWNDTTPEGKFEVIKAVLTHNTLPQAREVINFIFRVKGVPRWLFDYHTQVKFMTIMSIGCRDNNKLDSDIVYATYFSIDEEDKDDVLVKVKDLYEKALTGDGASWQSARAFLPQSYSHSYYFSQNLLAISNSLSSFKEFYKDDNTEFRKMYLDKLYYDFIANEILGKFPLLGEYLLSIFYKNKIANNLISYKEIRYFESKESFFERLSKMQYKDLTSIDKQYFERKYL